MNKKLKAFADKLNLSEFEKELLAYIWRNKSKDIILARVNTVAKSGMSRTVDFKVIYRGRLYDLNWLFGVVLKLSLTDNGLRLSGCGFDVIEHSVYRFYETLIAEVKPLNKKYSTYYSQF